MNSPPAWSIAKSYCLFPMSVLCKPSSGVSLFIQVPSGSDLKAIDSAFWMPESEDSYIRTETPWKSYVDRPSGSQNVWNDTGHSFRVEEP